MENRARKYQRERRSGALREGITALVEGELEDPRIGLVTVNEVQLAPGGKTARVYIEVAGSEQDAAESLEGLNASRGFIRHALAVSLGLRVAPELVFIIDNSEQRGGRVDELLDRIAKRKHRN